ncbi:LEC14B protein-like [Juglans microcarpa x Juglans regia]|uniref:LEC14B protein-like n=1 Tax=Juglans microcarpa x Juglans regia TaxID=2249226 RepID=UPI001B7F5681|nr:LEC14B protein-like [Juglans microcarpa x Juglans regia]
MHVTTGEAAVNKMGYAMSRLDIEADLCDGGNTIHEDTNRSTPSISPDQRHLVYASMSPIVHIVNVGSPETESLENITEIHEGLDFSADDDGGYSFGIFSVKF